jgi:hypothetical protein
METNLMQPHHTPLPNTDEILQHVQHAAELPNLSPEKKAALDKAATGVQEVLRTYFASIEKLSAESLPVSATPETSSTLETHQYTRSDLEKIGINPGKHFQTPLEDGSSTVREVSFGGSGIVVLSNTDATKYGVLDEIYTPDQYHTLAEKVSTGVYTPATQDTVPVETSVVIDTPPIESIPVVSNIATPHRRSLAELLGQTSLSTTPSQTDTPKTVPALQPAGKPDTAPAPTAPNQITSPVMIPKPTETKSVQILPVSPERIDMITERLEMRIVHKPVYDFIRSSLSSSWALPITAATRGANAPAAPSPTPAIAELLHDDMVMPTAQGTGVSHTQSDKLDPLSMFTSHN